MPNTTTPNMNLILPTIGSEVGPTYATDQNNSFTLVDQHDHSSGKGVQITSAGLNINSDLSLNGTNLTNSRTLRLATQASTPSGGLDVGILYRQGVDLFYKDGSGNVIRITQSGGISGTSGSIGGLASPASATYVSGTPAFVFQSAANTPANLDGGSLVLRNITASSKGITLNPPNALAANYSLTLPGALPGATSLVTMDASGNVAAALSVSAPVFTTSVTIGTSGAVLTNNGTIAIIPNFQLGSSAQAQVQAVTLNTVGIATNTGTNVRPIVVSANPSASGLMIVRGAVNSGGALVGGEGFTPSTSGTGIYGIVFSTVFTDAPSVTVTPASPSLIAVTNGISTGGATILVYNTSGVLTNGPFNFICIGQRT